MNHSNNKLRGLDISSNPEIDGVTISIPGNGLRTFIFARDTQTISAVRINGTEASTPLEVIELIIRYMRHCKQPSKDTENESEIILLYNE